MRPRVLITDIQIITVIIVITKTRTLAMIIQMRKLQITGDLITMEMAIILDTLIKGTQITPIQG